MKSKLHITAIILVLSLSIIAGSCKKLDEFPDEPEIEYIGFERLFNPDDTVFTRGVLKFSFQDGDGDLGFRDRDTMPPFNYGSEYYYNLVVTYFEIRNGVRTEVPLTFYNPSTQQFDTITQSSRFPSLTPDAVNKSISGEIYDTLFIYNYNSDFDSLMFEAFIYDRSLNQSNVITTDTIVRR